MELVRKYFPKIISDNDANYFAQLTGVLESVDELASMEIVKTPDSYKFRIIPSLPKYINNIITELIKFHNLYSIHINMSKSIKSTGIIIFEIET